MSSDTANPSARPKVPDVIDGSNLIRRDPRSPSEKPAEPQLTILRIKRKRNEEPLEALLVQQEAERQNSRGQRKMRKNAESNGKAYIIADEESKSVLPKLFRLAETVNEQSFKNVIEARKLKERITRRIQPGSRPSTPSLESRKEQRAEKQQLDAKTARYRVIQQNRRNKESPAGPPHCLPIENSLSRVESASEKMSSDLFHMFEAVKDNEDNKANILLNEDAEDDTVMCNFISMVKEYLTAAVEERNEAARKFEQTPAEDEDGYVYDVYYRDDTTVQTAFPAQNVGALIWGDEEYELMDDDFEDSDVVDSEDEDSNAEDFYQNDYPEEEDYDDVLDDDEDSSYKLSSDEEYY
ncbi:hypothetical protein NQZ79_g897 [Umbelopsis isabellina]|nr:hypothetical protein NQZ79_g897 [Umbelopsis isabellina]